MGDVIIFLLSKTQNSKRDKEKEEKRGELEGKMKVEEEETGKLRAVPRVAAGCQCWCCRGGEAASR